MAGHDHDHAHDPAEEEEKPTPRHYWEHTPSRRAVPQFDCKDIAKKYLDDMEKGGRLHNKRKR